MNLKSVWLLSQAAGRYMVPLKRGKIINFCSLLTFQGGLTVPAYAAAKGALGQLTKALSNEWSQHNVQVNGIAPGYIATDMCVLFSIFFVRLHECYCVRVAFIQLDRGVAIVSCHPCHTPPVTSAARIIR